jgi:hypothetical protein
VSFLSLTNTSNSDYKKNTDVSEDIPVQPAGVTQFWSVMAKTGSDGKITVGLTTDGSTKDAVYTIRAQKVDAVAGTGYTLNQQLYDTVKVKIEKGAVTVTASGDGSYYLGEEITISGTNTDTNEVFLFITGPNLNANGAQLDDPSVAIRPSIGSDGQAAQAPYVNQSETVKTDDTWEFKWDTSNLALDAGTYSIYAASKDVDKSGLSHV